MQEFIIKITSEVLAIFNITNDTVSNVLGTFIFLFGELLILFIIISFIVALLQIYVSKATIQKALTTKSKVLNSVLGGLLGAVTPFCSCSTIPLLVGLIKSNAPFSGMMTFLLTSPILNPAIIILFLTFFGIVPTLIYTGIAFIFAIVMGYILDQKGFAKYIKPLKQQASSCDCDSNATEITFANFEGTIAKRQAQAIKYAFIDAIKLFKQVLLYLVIGAGIGAFIYGLVPVDLLAKFAGANNYLAVPIAAILGIPMYIRTETMIPIASILVAKGVGLGVMVALIIGGAGASIPEVSMLGSIFKKQLVIVFVICIFSVATITGLTFNLVLN